MQERSHEINKIAMRKRFLQEMDRPQTGSLFALRRQMHGR